MSNADIHAIIFDSDGTLVDSEPISLAVLCELFATFDVVVPFEDAVENWSGADLHVVMRQVEAEHGIKFPATFLDDFRVRQLECLSESVQPIPGADDLLKSINKPRCVASNAPVVKVQLCLETTGLIKHFNLDRILSSYQVQAWKPDPAVFFHAAKQMQVDPKHCAVVEDSIYGVDAGIAAGMQVFAYDPKSEMPDRLGVTKVSRLIDLTDVLSS